MLIVDYSVIILVLENINHVNKWVKSGCIQQFYMNMKDLRI